jgi:hypothetical protein
MLLGAYNVETKSHPSAQHHTGTSGTHPSRHSFTLAEEEGGRDSLQNTPQHKQSEDIPPTNIPGNEDIDGLDTGEATSNSTGPGPIIATIVSPTSFSTARHMRFGLMAEDWTIDESSAE